MSIVRHHSIHWRDITYGQYCHEVLKVPRNRPKPVPLYLVHYNLQARTSFTSRVIATQVPLEGATSPCWNALKRGALSSQALLSKFSTSDVAERTSTFWLHKAVDIAFEVITIVPSRQRRWCFLVLAIAISGLLYHLIRLQCWYILSGNAGLHQPATTRMMPPSTSRTGRATDWANREQHYPVVSMIPLPTDQQKAIPRTKRVFGKGQEDAKAKTNREERRQTVKKAFQHAWSGYKRHA